jgi:hypothetical protein
MSITKAAPAKKTRKNLTVFSPFNEVAVEIVDDAESKGSKNNLYKKNAILLFYFL